MSLPLLFAFSFVVGFAAVVTPGTVSTAIVTESARRGFIVGPLVALGHCAVEFVMVALLALGLGVGLHTPGITNAIAVVGGGLLVVMGATMAWDGYRDKLRLPRPGGETRALGNWQLLGLGVAATVVNPFWYTWWVAVGAAYLALPAVHVYGLLGVLVFYLGHITGDLLWDSILSGVVGRGRRWITDRAYKWLIVACGAYLVFQGVVFVASPWAG